MANVFLKEEAGRKRIAKLLGVAPFRVDLTLTPTGDVLIEVDGKPASDEQMRAFWEDVAETVKKSPNRPN